MNEPIPIPVSLERSFRRIAESHGAPTQVESGPRHLTRQSLAALHFVLAVGHRIRFDHSRRAWFIWHGHRWHPDRTGEIRRLWLEVLAGRYREAVAIGDGEVRDRTIKAIQAAGALDSAIEAGLRIAASSEPTAMAGDEWDPDPWSLGCENGIVDLRTGVLRTGRPEDLITRTTYLAFDPSATCARWDRFLVEVFEGDQGLIDWFRRLLGASFVGTSKEILAVHHGTGNNGKSVGYRTLGHVAGDYGVEIGIETLIGGRRDAGAATSDLMRLRGARLAFTSEPDHAARLNGGTLKRLATIDRMSGRELHGRQQEWDPTHTIHLATNHLPEVDDSSDGFWRRIALIPWVVRFAKAGEDGAGPPEDPGLADELRTEASGILAWVVRGAVEFGESGLHPFPAAVARETSAYRADEDPLREFLLACISPADDDRATTVTELHRSYVAWADATAVPNVQRLNVKRFGRMFAERYPQLGWPVVRTSVGGRTAYRGVRLHVGALGDWAAETIGGSDGGFHRDSASSVHAFKASGNTGEMASEPTKPTDSAETVLDPAIASWDEDVAERATDDEAEGYP